MHYQCGLRRRIVGTTHTRRSVGTTVITAGPQTNGYEGSKAVPARPSGTVLLKVWYSNGKWTGWSEGKWADGSVQLSIWGWVLCVWRAAVWLLVTVGTDWAEERYGTTWSRWPVTHWLVPFAHTNCNVRQSLCLSKRTHLLYFLLLASAFFLSWNWLEVRGYC